MSNKLAKKKLYAHAAQFKVELFEFESEKLIASLIVLMLGVFLIRGLKLSKYPT